VRGISVAEGESHSASGVQNTRGGEGRRERTSFVLVGTSNEVKVVLRAESVVGEDELQQGHSLKLSIFCLGYGSRDRRFAFCDVDG